MSYAEQRERRQKEDANVSKHDFGWEEEQLPMLHSGFLERCKGDDSKSAFFLSIFFANGEYRCRLQDRQADEKAFIRVTSLRGLFEQLEAALSADDVEWTPDKYQRNGRNGM